MWQETRTLALSYLTMSQVKSPTPLNCYAGFKVQDGKKNVNKLRKWQLPSVVPKEAALGFLSGDQDPNGHDM